MRQRLVPLLLPTLLVLGLLGAWAGTSTGQLPPPPTVSLPTVTVPSTPLPPAPPPPSLPTLTTPPTPAPVTLPAGPPAEVPSTPAPSTPNVPQPQPAAAPASAQAGSTSSARNVGASSRVVSITNSQFSPSRLRPRRRDERVTPAALRATNGTEAAAPRSTGVQASPRRPVEHESRGGRLDTTLGTLRSAADAVPPALFVLALLAVVLLFVAAMPQPLRASWAGAALVHHRGTIAIAGVGVLAAAILSAGLLL